MSLTTKGSSRIKKYRERLKSNPELYKTAKQSHAAYMKMKRSEWTEEQKQLNREQSRERMNRYRKRKKAKEAVEKKQPRTRQELEKQKQQREKWKLSKQKQRENLSSQRQRRIREKDRERKRKKREELSPVIPLQSTCASSVEGSVSTPISTLSYGTTSALNKAISRAKSKLPKDPTKFADVLSKLIEKASPRKSDALKEKGLGLSQKNRWVNELSDTIKETYESMQGRTKAQVHVRREFVRQLATIVKNRNKSKVCRTLGINRKFFTRSCEEFIQKKRSDAITMETEKSIEDFFLDKKTFQ